MTRNRAPLSFAAKALFLFALIAALLPVGLASAADGSFVVPQDAADKRCPLPADGDDVKVNTPGSASSDGATVTAGPRSASWSAFEGYEITGACVKIGGKDGNLVFFGAGDGGYTADKYDISHVVVYVKPVEVEDGGDEDEGDEGGSGGGCEAEDGCDSGDENPGDECEGEDNCEPGDENPGDECAAEDNCDPGDENPGDGCEAEDNCDPGDENPGDECAADSGCELVEDGGGEPIEEQGGGEEPDDDGDENQPEDKDDEQTPADESTEQPSSGGNGGGEQRAKPAGGEAQEAVLSTAVEAPAELPYLGAAPIPAEAPHTGGLDGTTLPIVLVALLMAGSLVGLLQGRNARQP